MEEAEKAVAADEFDLEAWDVLVSAAQRTAGGAAAVLERVLRVYPTSEAHWRLLVDELRAHAGIDDAPVEAAFTRALAAVPVCATVGGLHCLCAGTTLCLNSDNTRGAHGPV